MDERCLAQDLQHSFRGMRRDAGFAAFAILIAGLGIGASSTVFSVVNALLLRPLPFRDPGRLVWIANGDDCTATQTEHYSDLRELNRSFSDLAGWSAYYRVGDSATDGNRRARAPHQRSRDPELLRIAGCATGHWKIVHRRGVPGEVFRSAGRAAELRLLARRFASDPNVVGRKLTLNNRPVTVVGVLPASFDFASVFAPGTPVDIFIPWPLTDKTKPAGNTMKIIGRLKPGATVQGAQAEFTLLGKQLESQHPERNGIAPRLSPAGTTRERTSESGTVRAGLRGGRGDVDCVRESFESAIGEVRQAAKGNGDAGGVRGGPFAAAAADAYRERGALVLRRGAGTGPRGGGHARDLLIWHAFNLPLLASVRIDGSALGFHAAGGGLLPAYSLVCCRRLQVRLVRGREALKDGSRGSSGGQAACLGPRRTGGFRDRLRLHIAGGRGTADAELSPRPRRESGISTGARGSAED